MGGGRRTFPKFLSSTSQRMEPYVALRVAWQEESNRRTFMRRVRIRAHAMSSTTAKRDMLLIAAADDCLAVCGASTCDVYPWVR